MGTITAGTGLVSGIDSANIIQQLIALESRPKIRLQTRIAQLTAQQSAILDVNSQLLALKTASAAFRKNKVFESVIASSSNAELFGATATSSAQVGTYKFIVKQLVSTSQAMSGGFASRNESPLGLDQLSFEFGNVRLSRDESLENLNGGDGAARGKIVVRDRAGETATIDLSDVVSISDVVDRINASEDVAVRASVSDQGLVVTDISGGSTSTLSITDASGYTTATDLGIADGVAANDGTVATGSSVLYLGGDSPLRSLNDGNGVLIRTNNPDLTITARDGTIFNIDLGRIDEDIDSSTLLSELNDGDGVEIDGDSDTPDLVIVDRDGTEHEIDLSGSTTVGDVISRISAQTSGRIAMTVHADGNKFTITDTVGTGTENLVVRGGEDAGDATAEGLGILNEVGVAAATFDGEIVPSSIDKAEAVTLQDVIDRINDALDTTETANGGRIVASIRADGLGLRVQDATGGGGNLIIESTAANPDAAGDLGIATGAAGVATSDFTATTRVIGGLSSVLVASINGGTGLDGATSIDVTDRAGFSFSVSTLDTFDTLEDILEELNNEAQANGVSVSFSLNAAGTGIRADDSSGGTGNLTITGDGATALGIAFDDDADVAVGLNVQRQYVSNATRLADLNYGRGIGTGTFKVTDGLGATADVVIGGDEKTVYDLITEINSKGLAINARVNDNGDGIIIEEDPVALGASTPVVPIKVETVSGSTARDLNILGTATDVIGGSIDGSYERRVDLDPSDSLADVVEKLNEAGIPVTAGVINTGNGAKPFRLNLSSGISGAAGDMLIDTAGVDLALSPTSRGRDAKVFFGAEDPADALLITSSDNTLDTVLAGVEINLLKADPDEVVTLTISANEAAVLGAANQLVTAFNDVIDTLDGYDFFDVDTLQKGLLLGDSTLGNVRSSMYRVLLGPAQNVDSQYRFLTQIGFSVDGEGKVKLDQDTFRERYSDDPDSVKALLAEYDVESSASEEIADGITIARNETTYNALGVANLFDVMLEGLTDSIDGVVPRREEALRDQIELNESRIEVIDQRLERRRETLQRQFIAMEQAIALLQNQQTTLGSIGPL